MLNLDRALNSPASVFASPSAVLEAKEMTRDQQIQALRQWHYDLLELQVATDENMGGGGDTGTLIAEVEAQLRRLDAEPSEGGPTRQG
ncbi:MAG TPA: hypothetical protein VLA56_17685 [Pseudomonadales bacterium]|nr:hypothetical protein [Pseudomonadales bacterium]